MKCIKKLSNFCDKKIKIIIDWRKQIQALGEISGKETEAKEAITDFENTVETTGKKEKGFR